MDFDIAALDAPRSYKLMTATVVPRPIAWLVTAGPTGQTNAAPFSFFNVFGGHPPVVCVGIGPRRNHDKDSLAHIRERREFVINLVSQELVAAMNLTATDFPREMDELAIAGLATEASLKIAVPRIARSPVALECTLKEVLALNGSGHLVIGQVEAVHIRDDAVLNRERCHVDTARLELVGRMQSPGGYVRTTDTFALPLQDYADWAASR